MYADITEPGANVLELSLLGFDQRDQSTSVVPRADYSQTLIPAKQITFRCRIAEAEEDDSADSELEREFQKRAIEWRSATKAISSVSDFVTHPAYQRIMAMGKPALPFILRDLRDESGHWFYALTLIAGKD